MMTRKPFIVVARDDERNELLRRLAVALAPKPVRDEQVPIYKRIPIKPADQE